MKPGLTCLWQIALKRNEISFEDWMKMDLRYIDNWSLGMDCRILLRTAKAVLVGEGR
jgi:lipopolysaccharide/colanic/teichoic acid biosynthesis glycosyltransferase